MNVKDKLIVALDVPTAREASKLVAALRGAVGMFKVGFQLFTAAGPDTVREIVKSGESVFLDLKFHDIPHTVASAGVAAMRLGVSIFNLHAAGGCEMMRQTVAAVSEAAAAEGRTRPAIIAVTVLTSANAATLSEVGICAELESQVVALTKLSETCGMDGVVASAREIEVVRAAVPRRNFLVVTPGIRPVNAGIHDQKRTMTPGEAMVAGADYLVVGRPITSAKDPARAAEDIVAEMAKS